MSYWCIKCQKETLDIETHDRREHARWARIVSWSVICDCGMDYRTRRPPTQCMACGAPLENAPGTTTSSDNQNALIADERTKK